MRREDLEAYLRRDWALFRRRRAAAADRSPEASFALAETLRRSAKRLTTPEARDLARALDWEHHLDLKKKIDRASAAMLRNGTKPRRKR